MSINEKILKEIKEKMHKELIEKKGIIDIDKYFLEYLRGIDATELAKKCDGSIEEAIDAIELLQKNPEQRKIGIMRS